MDALSDQVITFFKQLRISDYSFGTEEEFEDIICNALKKTINSQVIHIDKQSKYHKERIMRPDIVIANNLIIIELKLLSNSLNDIYRLYYQAVKYSKLAQEMVILYVYDPKFILKREDILDLESIPKIIVICRN